MMLLLNSKLTTRCYKYAAGLIKEYINFLLKIINKHDIGSAWRKKQIW